MAANDSVLVQFKQAYLCYAPNEVAGFVKEDADVLIARGIAKPAPKSKE